MDFRIRIIDGSQRRSSISESIDYKSIGGKQYQIVCFGINENDIRMPVDVDPLQSITDSIQFFDIANKCIEHLEQTKSMDIFIIVSEQQIDDFISRIPIQENIRLIYIIRQNYGSASCIKYREQTREYGKVKQCIYTNFDDLFKSLKNDTIYYLVNAEHYNLDIEKIEKSVDSFIKPWFPEFIDILCKISYPEDQLQKLVRFLRLYTKSNEVDTFEREYKIKGAIYYYTKETFIYQILNEQLRQHLYQELNAAHKELIQEFSNQTHLPSLYRGQMMPKSVIDGLLSNIYIQNMQIFSSSFEKNVSLMFRNLELTQNSFVQNVLFEIKVDLRTRTAPYADIHKQSHFQDEREVLFMVGNRFRVENVKFDEKENYYLVNLVLLNDFEPIDLRISKDYCDRRNLKNCISTLAFQMYHIPETDLIVFFDELMKLYPSEKWIAAVMNFRQGQYQQYEKKDYHRASAKYDCALKIWLSFNNDIDLNCSIDIGHVYHQLGVCHQSLENAYSTITETFDNAQTSYLKADENSRSEHERTEILNYLAYIYTRQMELYSQDIQMMREYGSKANDYRRKFIEKINQNELYDRLIVSESHMLMAVNYEKMKDYDGMLNSYKMALDIYQQQDKKKDFKSAIIYQELKHNIRLQYNEPKEGDSEITLRHKKQRTQSSHLELAKLYEKDNQDTLALKYKVLANVSEEDEIADETTAIPIILDI
ncbi:unnamed protein product [Adineta ricciae]|uniref:Uncharacterized protein n=1 Tax=Adineta ricciae TaxID=249248 RepID=A0A814ELX6_ADIRI|nr:unnamed protein product [Adineta ricciae]